MVFTRCHSRDYCDCFIFFGSLHIVLIYYKCVSQSYLTFSIVFYCFLNFVSEKKIKHKKGKKRLEFI